MISPDQRKRYWAELHAVMEKVGSIAPRGPSPSPGGEGGRRPDEGEREPSRSADIDTFRAQFHAQHNLPASTKDFTRAHFDAFLAACHAITKPADLKPQLRAFDQPKARLLHKILVEQAAQLDALYAEQVGSVAPRGPSPSPGGEGAYPARVGEGERALRAAPNSYRTGLNTIEKISRDKFRGRLPADLSDSPRSVFSSRYSELEMLMFTVARTISELRQERGWTVHELLWNAGLGKTCACAQCKKQSTPRRNRREEILTNSPDLADNVPF